MPKPRATVLAITSDLHCGSTVALCPPTIRLDDGGEYVASKAQRWLWQNWESFWSTVDDVRTRENASLICGFNGDLTDGDHHGTTQIMSGNPNAQAAAVTAAMAVPLALKPDALYFTRGTEAHVGKSASLEERIADGLRRDKRPVIGDPETGTASWWHWKGTMHGVRLDLAHHGRVGQRPWTKPNVTANLAAEIFYEHAREDFFRNRPPTAPHLAIRSHMHRFVDTHDQHPVRVIQTPAWQLHTAFTHKVATETRADIGGLIVVLRDGQPSDVRPVLYLPD